MKVLVAHNRYTSRLPSGENAVVDDEIALLRDRGVDVVAYLPSSDDLPRLSVLDKAKLPMAPVRFGPGVREIERLLVEERPDVLHLHNPYPLLSPWVVRAAHRAGVPVVHSVHNYRVACMKGTFFRDGHECEDCLGRRVKWPGSVHGCYRGSRVQSATMTVGLTFHRRTWPSVDRHLVLSEWMKAKLVEEGVPIQRIALKRNSVAGPDRPAPVGSGVLFVGRLDAEKGIDLLLEAWDLSEAHWTESLTIVGEGPLRPLVEQRARASDSVVYRGRLSGSEVSAAMERAATVVIPSRCPEGPNRVMAEAFAHGRAVVSPALPMRSLILGAGQACAPTPAGLAVAIDAALSRAAEYGAEARRRWEAEFTPETVARNILAVYAEVAGER